MTCARFVRHIARATVERSKAQSIDDGLGGHPGHQNLDYVVVHKEIAMLREHEIWWGEDRGRF